LVLINRYGVTVTLNLRTGILTLGNGGPGGSSVLGPGGPGGSGGDGGDSGSIGECVIDISDSEFSEP
jgi:hypothetical protein